MGRKIVYKHGGANAFEMEIPLGHVPGQKSVNKFGGNVDIAANTKEDVWDVGGEYPYPSNGTAPITHIVSTSAIDTEPIEIQGLDINGAEIVQTITLTGTTIAPLTTALWRVFRLKNVGTSDLVGAVDAVDSGETEIYARISIGNNQTLMALYTVPLGYIALLTKYYATTVDATNKSPTSTRFGLWARDTTVDGVFQLKHVVGIPAGGSMVEHAFIPFPSTTELTDIKITALPLDQAADVAAGFDLILVEE